SLKTLLPSPHALAFGTDGQTLFLGGKDSGLYLVDIAKDKVSGILRGHLGWARGLALSADGKTLLSGSQDGTVRLWDPWVTPSPEVLTAHKGAVTGVAVAPNDKLFATAGADGTIKLWQPATGKEETTKTPMGHQGGVL